MKARPRIPGESWGPGTLTIHFPPRALEPLDRVLTALVDLAAERSPSTVHVCLEALLEAVRSFQERGLPEGKSHHAATAPPEAWTVIWPALHAYAREELYEAEGKREEWLTATATVSALLEALHREGLVDFQEIAHVLAVPEILDGYLDLGAQVWRDNL